MDIRMTGAVFLFMRASVGCLVLAWHRVRRSTPVAAGWRPKVLTAGAYLASASQALAFVFLAHGLRSDRQSFTDPASPPWVVANWITVVCWGFTVFSAILGKGNSRRALLLWGLITPLAAWMIIMIGLDY